MKKILTLLLSLLLMLGCFGCAQDAQTTVTDAATTTAAAQTTTAAAPETEMPTQDLVILYTNDVHCAVDTNIGYAGLTAYKKELEEQGNQVMLVDAGDHTQGSYVGTVSEGAYLVDIMNQVGYDVATLGNHEVDYGVVHFLELAQRANFQYVSCNLVDTEGKRLLDAYTMLDWGSKKVAFVGVTTPKTMTSSKPGSLTDGISDQVIYGFCQDESGEKLYAAVQEAVDAAREAGADYVIALAHLGIMSSAAPWTAGEVIANTTGIDVLIDGHSHSEIPCNRVRNKDGKWVLHTQTGEKLNNIGMLLITGEGNISTGLISGYEKKDDEITAYIQGIQEQFEDEMKKVVGKTDYDLVIEDPETGARIVRNMETNMSDLISDAFRWITDADIALENAGAIRCSIKAGDITYGDLNNLLAFGNEILVKEVTGQQILDALEVGVCNMPDENGSLLHPSGLTYEVDITIPSSVKYDEDRRFISVDGEYRVRNVKVGDEALDLNRTYTVACNDYIMHNPQGSMSMFDDCKMIKEPFIIDVQVLLQYITEELGGVIPEEYADPFGQGRILFTQK